MTGPPDQPRPRTLTKLDDLAGEGLVADSAVPSLGPIADTFRIRISPAVREAIASGGQGVARQFVPTLAEAEAGPGDLADPVGDRVHQPVAGLTHRYPDRVIVHVTQTCEVYCRFCFRRETVGAAGPLPEADLAKAIAYIAATPDVREAILTGGDPLSLSARRLGDIMTRLAAIPHVEVLRIHTRVPVVAPERVGNALMDALDVGKAVYLVIHTNHPGELTEGALAAIARLNRAGIALLSQTVLLRGVNDDAATLEHLFRALLRNRVKPYYLHHCDLARGAGHFRTTIEAGQKIMAQLRGRLSGAALPTYVLDIPGGFGKVPVGPGYLTRDGSDWRVTDPSGRVHAYSDPGRE